MAKTGQTTNLPEAKLLARQEARMAMKGLSLDQAAKDSQVVCHLILESDAWQQAAQLLLYIPISGEIDINPLIKKGLERGKEVALPRFSPENNEYEACVMPNLDELVIGKFGIPEPSLRCQKMDIKQLDLIIVSGVAFDGLGGRLGRGGGFFDRLLADISAKKCGVCFDQQVHPDVPVERHDVKMDMIATPSGWLVPQPA
jgi:5-formyltetrahydrofolate cyclo-ligase